MPRRFLRKRGAAGEVFLQNFSGLNPLRRSRASSPEGGALSALTGRCVKAPPLGELSRSD